MSSGETNGICDVATTGGTIQVRTAREGTTGQKKRQK
jgi:hypothetical protein